MAMDIMDTVVVIFMVMEDIGTINMEFIIMAMDMVITILHMDIIIVMVFYTKVESVITQYNPRYLVKTIFFIKNRWIALT